MSPNKSESSKVDSSHFNSSKSLGTILKNRREELELDLSKVERDTKIQRRYLEYIETSNYERLRDDIYSRGYVKNYADYLGLESAPILLLYKKERNARLHSLKSRGAGFRQKIGLTPIDSPRVIITPRTFIVLSVVSLLGLILTYMIWQFSSLSAAPRLTLDNPEEQRVTSSIAYVSGRVDEGAEVFINNSPILTNSQGAFRERVALVDGVNQVRITAKNKLGKTAALSKVYIAEISDEEKSTSLSEAPAFDGVKLNVSIGDSASWIIVVADDKEIYRGTMLERSSAEFQAADRLRISVGNAGSVNVTLTNKQLNNKNIGNLGANNEIKRDLEFKKDTVAL